MIMKAIPKELMTEAVQKRHGDPAAAMLMNMVKYQPGARKEKEALLQQIQNPKERWKTEQALVTLKLWKRRTEGTESRNSRPKYSLKCTR